MGPPPSAPACGCPGVVRVVLGEGAFGQHRLPAFVPCVERLAPPDRVLGFSDAGERVGESLELPSGLQSGFGGQVGPGVALHVDEAALDARARPCLGAGLADAFHAVADEHVGRCDPFEQGLVGGRALAVAPLPGEHLTVFAVDRDQQAPAVHVGAVGHDRMMHHTVGFDARGELPAPIHAFAEVARAFRAPALGCGPEQPVEELVQLAPTRPVGPGRRGSERACGATPSLGARGAPAVFDHRVATHRASARPD